MPKPKHPCGETGCDRAFETIQAASLHRTRTHKRTGRQAAPSRDVVHPPATPELAAAPTPSLPSAATVGVFRAARELAEARARTFQEEAEHLRALERMETTLAGSPA
jgi:hypothetical protein